MQRPMTWLHPLLFAAYPVLALFAHNEDELLLGYLWSPLWISVAAAALLLGVLRLLLRNGPAAAFATSTLVLLVFSYGHVFSPVLLPLLGRHRMVLIVWALVAAVALVPAVRRRRVPPRLTAALNVMAVLVVGIALARIVVYESTRRRATDSALATLRVDAEPLPDREPLGYAPDIYYFVMDRYPNAMTLREQFGFDNGPFLGALRERGFVVLDEARANYATTPLSLASSLNMEYLDRVRTLVGEDATDTSVTFGLVQDHRVQRLLRQRGYTYVHVGSWWEPTRRSELADVNVTYAFPVSEFVRELLETTVAWPVFYRLVDFGQLHRKQVLFKIEKMPEIVALPSPKFVFAHFLVPHPPYVFDRDGKLPTTTQLAERGERASFIHQVEFVNARLREIVDGILAHSEHPPVIVLQSDEGPHLAELLGAGPEARMDEEIIKMKTYILNAILLPGISRDALDATHTPVNTFRLVFNTCFGADYPMLANTSYWFADARRPYRYVDVTHVQY